MDNKSYFDYSLNNKDDIFDYSKPDGVLVISENSHDTPTELMIANDKIIDLITAYQVLKEKKDSINCKNLISDIVELLDNTDNINYSPLCNYFQVLGYSYSSYKSSKLNHQEKINIISQMVDLYIEHRHKIYKSHGYSPICLQINSDLSSSRRKGKTGIEKMIQILSNYSDFNFAQSISLSNFLNSDYAYILPDKGDKNVFNEFLKQFNVRFQFREQRDNKYPDMLLKINNDYFIIEHKLTNGGGGSQNAEINEIISFIGYSEEDLSIKLHYVSCLAGDYISSWNSNQTATKQNTQYNNIVKQLNSFNENYFVNGKGLGKMIEDYLNKN